MKMSEEGGIGRGAANVALCNHFCVCIADAVPARHVYMLTLIIPWKSQQTDPRNTASATGIRFIHVISVTFFLSTCFCYYRRRFSSAASHIHSSISVLPNILGHLTHLI